MLLTLQIIIVISMIFLAGFFAGAETGVYRISRFKLRLGVQQKKPTYSLLSKVVNDSHGLVLSLLIGNNLANYIVTSMVTYMLLSRVSNAHTAELYATIIMTPLLFIFVDIIPKNVYYYTSDSLMPRLAPLLWFFHRLFTFCGAVAILKIISHLLIRLFGSHLESPAALTATSRHNIRQIIQESRDEGLLSSLQKDIMHRMVSSPEIILKSIMIPLTNVQTVSIETDNAALTKKLKQHPYTRLPVFSGHSENIIGFIDIYQALSSNKTFSSLENWIRPIAELSSKTTVLDALNSLKKNNQKIALVITSDRNQKPVGIVTIKDLLSELTGELIQ